MNALPGLAALLLVLPLAGCWPGGEEADFNGYVEADLVHVGAQETARLVSLAVARGDNVDEGQRMFALDSEAAEAALAEAAARLAGAEAELADLQTGQRPEEIAVIEARREEVLANLEAAQRDYARRETLHSERVVSDATIDETQARFRSLQAQLAQIDREIETARLPARPDRIAAAEAAVEAARASLRGAEARLDRLSGEAPNASRVEETFFEPGETVPAGQPVVSLLPDGALRVRFFVPQQRLSQIAVGDALRIGCDGCAESIEATVTFVARDAEFTPPVIYSVNARDKLVYMVEARPAAAGPLKVGQPVDVRLVP